MEIVIDVADVNDNKIVHSSVSTKVGERNRNSTPLKEIQKKTDQNHEEKTSQGKLNPLMTI